MGLHKTIVATHGPSVKIALIVEVALVLVLEALTALILIGREVVLRLELTALRAVLLGLLTLLLTLLLPGREADLVGPILRDHALGHARSTLGADLGEGVHHAAVRVLEHGRLLRRLRRLLLALLPTLRVLPLGLLPLHELRGHVPVALRAVALGVDVDDLLGLGVAVGPVVQVVVVSVVPEAVHPEPAVMVPVPVPTAVPMVPAAPPVVSAAVMPAPASMVPVSAVV